MDKRIGIQKEDFKEEQIYPLNEKGKSQAKKTKEKLEGIKFDKVFSSPLKRALETAKIIADEPIDIDYRIIERCNGQLEGKLKTECENMVDFTDENEVKLGMNLYLISEKG